MRANLRNVFFFFFSLSRLNVQPKTLRLFLRRSIESDVFATCPVYLTQQLRITDNVSTRKPNEKNETKHRLLRLSSSSMEIKRGRRSCSQELPAQPKPEPDAKPQSNVPVRRCDSGSVAPLLSLNANSLWGLTSALFYL